MMEIVFSESAGGALKMAQRYGEGPYIGEASAICIKHKDGRPATPEEREEAQRAMKEWERLEWERAVPLGGRSCDVYGLGLYLSVGDIAESTPGPRRLSALAALYDLPPEDAAQQAARHFNWTLEALEDARARAVAGEAIRIWYSSQPEELCGLFWFMDQLEQWQAPDAPLALIKLPDWEPVPAGQQLPRSASWAGIAPGQWHRYLPLLKPAPPQFRQGCAARWRALQRENAPLRAVVSGRLVSVPADFYDGFIRNEIAREQGDFEEAAVLGRVLSLQLGIGDALIAGRIQQMVQSGALAVVRQAAGDQPSYRRILRAAPR